MTRHSLLIAAAIGSAALLIGALGSQYLGHLVPCELCLLQRWPHVIAIVLAIAALVIAGSALPTLGTLTMLVSAGFGLYHTGVERGWWQGPDACSARVNLGGSAKDVLNQLMAAPVVQCNQVQWSFLHLSMASWNALLSLAFMLIWLGAARRS